MVVFPKPLQVVWWHCYIDSISKSKGYFLEITVDVKNSSNDSPWICKFGDVVEIIGTDYWNKLFSVFRAGYMSADIFTVMRINFPHLFSIRFIFGDMIECRALWLVSM